MPIHRDPDSRLATADLDRLHAGNHYGVGRAIQELVEQTIRSRRKGAGQELVDALHGRVGAQPHRLAVLVWHAMTQGLIYKYQSDGSGAMNCLASFCWDARRIAILRAVAEAGPPEWFSRYPGRSAADLKFGQVEDVVLPQGLPTKRDWFLALNSFEPAKWSGYDYQFLQHVAYEHVSGQGLDARALEAVQLAIEFAPELPGLAKCGPEFAALVRQEVMKQAIAKTLTEPKPPSPPTAPRSRSATV